METTLTRRALPAVRIPYPVALALLLLLFVLLVPLAARFVPVYVDYGHFRDAGRALVNGVQNDNPYYFNVPWLSAILIPFAVQDDATGNALLLMCGLAAFAYIAYRFKARPVTMALFLTSPGVVANLVMPNIDWLPLLGALLAPRYGLFLAIIKPQVGAGLVALWLWQAWRAGRARAVLAAFAPVSAAALLSALLCGPWFLKSSILGAVPWNTSLFPASLPFGLLLLALALSRARRDWAIAASVLVSPYVSNPSWAGAFLPFMRSARLMLAASLFWWICRIVVNGL